MLFLPCGKSDVTYAAMCAFRQAMLLTQRCCLRRDVCLRHVADYLSFWGAKRRENPPEGNHIIKPRKILLYLRGEKGANKHKSEHCRPRQCDFKSAVCAVGKLRIYLNFGYKPKYNSGDSQNITFIKSKYNLRSKYNRLRQMWFSTLKTAYFQRIYFLFFLFKISKCINA